MSPGRPVLTLNAGSSSLKFALFHGRADQPDLVGLVDRIGDDQAVIRAHDAEGHAVADRALQADERDGHVGAAHAVLAVLDAAAAGEIPAVVGHRIVHGGPDLVAPVVLDAAILERLAGYAPFAPLHQPHNLEGVAAARAAFPKALQIGCFDTAFHRHHPFVEDAYALPRAYFDQGVRRYGFHGLSYDYIASWLARNEPDLHAGRVVVAHLGNGASACAMQGGRSVASTMGFSALDGLAMGTRCGQIDPGVLLYLIQQQGMDGDQIAHLLYKESGLLGLSGLSNDMRTLTASDRPEAAQAIAYFVHRLRREVAALAAAMGGCDALIFTAGIGENAPAIRAAACEGMGWMGLAVDPSRNQAGATDITAPGARARVLVVPTNEELVIARAARTLLAAA